MTTIVDVCCAFLVVVTVIGTAIAALCAVEHADLFAISEKPLGKHDKKTLIKFAKIGGISGLVVTACLVIRSQIQGESFLHLLASVGVYKVFIVPGCWITSYLLPSKRKSTVKRRAKLRKAST